MNDDFTSTEAWTGYGQEAEEYTVSVYVQRIKTRVIKPRWWELWKEEQGEEYLEWERHSIILTKAEADILISAPPFSPIWTLFFRAWLGLPLTLDRLQITQESSKATPYIPQPNGSK